jgi:prefoldin alpha subunit
MAEDEKADGQGISTQEDLQQAVMYLEYLKEQITTLKEQFEILDIAVKEHIQAIETMKDFENIEKNQEILIPIGADSLVFAKVADPSKVIINIGAGIAQEKKIDEAVENLSGRIENIEENKNKIQATIQNLTEQATMLSSNIEQKYREMQIMQGSEIEPGPGNVS